MVAVRIIIKRCPSVHLWSNGTLKQRNDEPMIETVNNKILILVAAARYVISISKKCYATIQNKSRYGSTSTN